MKRIIFKYQLSVAGGQALTLAKGSIILACQAQRDVITLWVACPIVFTEYEIRRFTVVATGGTCQEDWTYIDTVQIGWTVWHVFEEPST